MAEQVRTLPGALDGIRVLDLSRILAGLFAAQILGGPMHALDPALQPAWRVQQEIGVVRHRIPGIAVTRHTA